jgi:SNF2 family DNA or RNA helicase
MHDAAAEGAEGAAEADRDDGGGEPDEGEGERRRLAFVRERIESLRARSELCCICQSDPCGVMLDCGHTFCRRCISEHVRVLAGDATCPTCRRPMHLEQARGVVIVGTKMETLASAIAELGRDDGVIVFVQWKSILRSMRAVLRGRGLRTFLLDGNGAQRARCLQDFEAGGVLLLCMNDSFAGLHLPHARHIIFAHALVGEPETVRALEYQAIGRCLRHGQTREVSVQSFVLADSPEEEWYRATHAL